MRFLEYIVCWLWGRMERDSLRETPSLAEMTEKLELRAEFQFRLWGKQKFSFVAVLKDLVLRIQRGHVDNS